MFCKTNFCLALKPEVTISIYKNIENIIIYSGTTYRNYRTLLNNYYLPVIDELFHYESTEAVRSIRHRYHKIRYLIKHINIRRFFILLVYSLIVLFIIAFIIIGCINFLFLPIQFVKMLLNRI